MSDKIIQELWQIKDAIANEHGYDIDALVEHLRSMKHKQNHRVVNLRSMKKKPNQAIFPTGIAGQFSKHT